MERTIENRQPSMKLSKLPRLQPNRGHTGHALSSSGRQAAMPAIAILSVVLMLACGCGKREVPDAGRATQNGSPQPAIPASVQRQQPAPTPPPAATAPVRQTNLAHPAGAPLTRPAGASKPVPVVP